MKNKYCYIVIKKWFYKNFGYDTAGGIAKEDIRVFSNIGKAKLFVESEINNSKRNNDIEFEFYEEKYNEYASTKIVKTWNYYQPTYKLETNIRYAYTIQKQLIE